MNTNNYTATATHLYIIRDGCLKKKPLTFLLFKALTKQDMNLPKSY